MYPQAAFRGGLLASVAPSGVVCGAGEERTCFACDLGGHVSPSRELWSNFGCCAVTQSPK